MEKSWASLFQCSLSLVDLMRLATKIFEQYRITSIKISQNFVIYVSVVMWKGFDKFKTFCALKLNKYT